MSITVYKNVSITDVEAIMCGYSQSDVIRKICHHVDASARYITINPRAFLIKKDNGGNHEQ